MLEAIRSKEAQLSSQRHVLEALTGLEDQVQAQLGDLEAENANLRQELERLDAQNNNLQAGLGHGRGQGWGRADVGDVAGAGGGPATRLRAWPAGAQNPSHIAAQHPGAQPAIHLTA